VRDDLWERAKEIFERGIELPATERDAALDRECRGDAELRAHVESLLNAHVEAGEFLHDPTVDPRVMLGGESSGRGGSADEIGTVIGRYKLLERIGEGGFGDVYMAQQETPVRRRVALKIIKPGMDTRQTLARFEAERQALAMMDHPNIAQVFDAGEAPSGRPYFVMELVRGEAITAYCDANRLSARERIELLIPVCQAVQHAHQKGVIHRDLKPGNILISLHDERPVPKIIDFGIAKAMDRPLTERTLFTEFRQFVGTPAYMSPEQAGRSGLDIDTRSDVYSLGVVLYELLTSTTPFDAQTLRQSAYEEMQRIIREVDPPRPSTRLGSLTRTATAGGGRSGENTAAQVASLRRTDPQALRRTLAGELDWIAMKCLEKDRMRRYDSAGDLARDLERYLRDEPVAAGPPSAAYRLRKLARRHRAALAVSAVVVAAVLGGLGLSIAGFVAANRARGQAETNALRARQAADKAEAINAFLLDMLATADPMHRNERNVTVREVLDEAARKVSQGQMDGQAEAAAAIRTTIGRAYRGLALYGPAGEQLRDALARYERLRGGEHIDVATALQELATLIAAEGDATAAERMFRRSLEMNRRLRDAGDGVIAANMSDLATTLTSQARLDEAEKLLAGALAIARLPQNAKLPVLPEVLNNSAYVHYLKERYEQAEEMYREALVLNRKLLGEAHPNIATNMDNIATVLMARGDLEGAEAAFRDALAMRRRLLGSEHPDVATSLHNLAVVCWRRKKPAEAEPLLRESLEILRTTRGLGHPDTLTVNDSLVSVVGSENFGEAERLLLAAYAAAESSSLVTPERRAALALRISQLYEATERADEAARWKARSEGGAGATSQPAGAAR